MSGLSKAIAFIRGLSHTSLFPWPALHFEGAYGVVFTGLIAWPHHWWIVLLGWVAFAALHELVWDTTLAVPTVGMSEAWQNFLQYLPGAALAVIVWMVWFR